MHIVWAHTHTDSCHKEASQAEMRADVTHLDRGDATSPEARRRAFKTLVSGVKYQPGQIHCGQDGGLIVLPSVRSNGCFCPS